MLVLYYCIPNGIDIENLCKNRLFLPDVSALLIVASKKRAHIEKGNFNRLQLTLYNIGIRKHTIMVSIIRRTQQTASQRSRHKQ
jgi:hypothetical protein